MVTLDNFEGHLTLYCKGHYAVNKVDFLTGLRRIWAVRCGFDVCTEEKAIQNFIGTFDNMKALNQAIKDMKNFVAKVI